jgi:hypothetical protein
MRMSRYYLSRIADPARPGTCRRRIFEAARCALPFALAMRGHDSLRASDAAIDRLREAAGEGRLEPHELEQRIDGALRCPNGTPPRAR